MLLYIQKMTKTKRKHFGGNRTYKQRLMDCVHEKTKLEKYLDELTIKNDNNFNLLLKKIDNLEKKDNEQEDKLKEQEDKLKEQHIEIGFLQTNIIYANILTSLQDVNNYKKIYDRNIISKRVLNTFRNDRNEMNHFINITDSEEESENKIQYIYEKLLEIKEKKPSIVKYFNKKYNGLVTNYLKFLNGLKINYNKETFEKNKSKYEDWWNHLP